MTITVSNASIKTKLIDNWNLGYPGGQNLLNSAYLLECTSNNVNVTISISASENTPTAYIIGL